MTTLFVFRLHFSPDYHDTLSIFFISVQNITLVEGKSFIVHHHHYIIIVALIRVSHSHLSIALEAGKVAHMPGLALRLGALVGEDDLVAGAAPGLEGLGVVTAAVEPAVPPKVD